MQCSRTSLELLEGKDIEKELQDVSLQVSIFEQQPSLRSDSVNIRTHSPKNHQQLNQQQQHQDVDSSYGKPLIKPNDSPFINSPVELSNRQHYSNEKRPITENEISYHTNDKRNPKLEMLKNLVQEEEIQYLERTNGNGQKINQYVRGAREFENQVNFLARDAFTSKMEQLRADQSSGLSQSNIMLDSDEVMRQIDDDIHQQIKLRQKFNQTDSQNLRSYLNTKVRTDKKQAQSSSKASSFLFSSQKKSTSNQRHQGKRQNQRYSEEPGSTDVLSKTAYIQGMHQQSRIQENRSGSKPKMRQMSGQQSLHGSEVKRRSVYAAKQLGKKKAQMFA